MITHLHFDILDYYHVMKFQFFLKTPGDTLLLIKMAMKCADLGHFTKQLALHLRWNSLVLEELWIQVINCITPFDFISLFGV